MRCRYFVDVFYEDSIVLESKVTTDLQTVVYGRKCDSLVGIIPQTFKMCMLRTVTQKSGITKNVQ